MNLLEKKMFSYFRGLQLMSWIIKQQDKYFCAKTMAGTRFYKEPKTIQKVLEH